MLCVMVVRDHVVACVHERHGSPRVYSLFCSLKTVVGASVHRAASTSPYELGKIKLINNMPSIIVCWWWIL